MANKEYTMPTNTHPPLLPALRRKAGFFALKAAAVLMLWFLVPMSVFKLLGSVGPVISWLLLLPFLASFLLWVALWLAPLAARLVQRYGPSAVPVMRSLTLATAKATRSGGQWAVEHGPGILRNLGKMTLQLSLLLLQAWLESKPSRSSVSGDASGEDGGPYHVPGDPYYIPGDPCYGPGNPYYHLGGE